MPSVLAGAVETAPVTRLHERQSYDPADFPVPDGREEEWRFTPLRRLRGLHDDAPAGAAQVTVEVGLAPELKADFAKRDSVLGHSRFVPSDRVSARAYDMFDEATVIEVPAEAETSAPTFIRLTGSDATVASYGHTIIKAGPMSRAVIVLDHRGSAAYADNVELIVGDGASLSVVSLQDWAPDTVHLSHHDAFLGRDATLKHAVVSLGGSVVRLAPSVHYGGPGGDATLTGMYFADAGQHLEHRLFVDHDVPRC